MKVTQRFPLALLVACFALCLAAPPAAAQSAKLGKDYYEDSHNGYRFRYPLKWSIRPVQAREQKGGLICEIDGPAIATRMGNKQSMDFRIQVHIFKLEEEAVLTPDEEEGSGGLKRRVKKETGRPDIADVIEKRFSSLRDFEKDNPVEEEDKKIKKLTADHRTWKAFDGNVDILLDAWTFRLNEYDICLVFDTPEQHEKKWLKLFEQAAKTFEEMARTETAAELTEAASYADRLAYHTDAASRVPGWRAVPTPSEQYVILTSLEDKAFIEEVIDRLERSRDIFEQDFPPKNDIEHVSVVRVCKDAGEFHSYGNTPRGVGGWFNPGTTELVLYDNKAVDRNATLSVMSHEAFHQYCHFLFGESEAHRWFDEGHGDYYGGIKVKRGKAELTPRMPSGYDRLPYARQAVREENYTPLDEHINASHQEWQSRGILSYSQSWSIVYMLRQGAIGKVPRKVWKDEYANIIPAYMSTLYEGFQKAYADLLAEREAEAKEEGRELEEEERDINRDDLETEKKTEIWEAAIEASWGQVDLAEFEENWALYVKKYLKG